VLKAELMSKHRSQPVSEPGLFLRAARLCGRFARARTGVTAIETALVAPMFIVLVSGIAEVSAMLLTMRMLDNATESAARLIRVGDAATRTSSAEQFKQSVCAGVPRFADCAGNLSVKVVSARDLSGLAGALAATSATPGSPSFNPGLAEAFVAVETRLDWPSFSPLFSGLTPTLVTFEARSVFRNEPFPESQTGSGR
jgi:Flp pilus assembly protein TadG